MFVTTLVEFTAEVRGFLAAYPLRKSQSRQAYRWGQGSDEVSLFREPDRGDEAARIAEVRAWRHELDAARLAWITGPVEYGGRGLTGAHQRAFDQAAADHDVPSSVPLGVSLGMVVPTVLHHGTDAAKRRYLRALQAGAVIGCQLFSEPGAGSDLAGVATRAVPDGDAWRISGQKVWTSGAHYSDVGLALCQTSAGPRHRNLTAFLVDLHAPGVDVRPLRQMTGGSSFNEVFLDDVAVADDHRLGEVDGGWAVAMTTLTHERTAIGGSGLGGHGLFSTDRLKALLLATGRADDPVIRQEAARLIGGLRTAQYTRLRAEAARRAGQAPGPEGSLGKLALTRNLRALSDLVTSVLGPALAADTGGWGTYAWATYVLGVPGARIGGGTDEVMKNVVAERVLGLPREPGGRPG